jgi:DNA-binding IscR family transcriptional regulator
MSSHPEEIEDGEIVEDFEEEEVMFEDEDEVDMASLMTSLLATEDGETVCSALVSIAQQLQTQNKILIKMLSHMKK